MSVIPSSAVRRGRFDEEIMPLQQTKKKKNRNAEGLDGSFFNTFPPARETT